MKRLIVAIDGPSGAGKGTVARSVARRLGYTHIDTGAMYRAVGWKALQDGVDLTDQDALVALARRMRLHVGDGVVRVDDQDIAQAIRNAEIDEASAMVARQPRVRDILIAQQRQLGARGGVVMEGRDITTVVFPSADVKIYLDASPEERARRRASDPAHAASRMGTAVRDVASALEARDLSDKTRTASPLTLARDAHLIDTTSKPIDRVVEDVLEIVRNAGG